MCICEPKKKLKRNYSAMENTEAGTMASTADIEEDEESASAAAGTAMEVAPSPVITASYYSKDVSDPFATPGQCGLYNLGNTCFMNAGLQCLLSTTPLLKFFLEQFTLDASTKDTLTTYFYQLVRKIWSGQYSIVYPRDFKNALGLFHVQFQDFRQHDCQEFLVLFLDTLHQQLKQEEEAVQNNLQRAVTVENRDQLNNSIDAKSYSEDGDSVPPIASDLPSLPPREDSETVSYVIQSELPTLLKSVVRTDSSGDLEKSQAEVNELEPILNNVSNLKQRIPKIEEFYAKDTKTLNTNVLSEDFGKDDLATDSEKFPKQELNIFAENDLAMHVPVEAVAVAHNKDDSARKGPKNTNIQAEKFNKMQKSCEMDAEGDGIVKKMKFECTEKNFQINVQSKLNKDLEIDEQKLKLAQMEMDGVNLRKDLGVQKSLDSDMCDSIMKTHLLEDKCPPCAAPDGDYMRTAVKTKKKNCEDCVQNTEKQAPKNVKSKKSQLSENSSKKFKCEMKHEGSPANSILSTDNEDDREEGGFQNSETTEGDLMEREEEVQADTEEEAAEKAWENYIRDNHSVIISTFQGQFKSTVVCSECSHVSVTFEPFMYLSVPLPHASDRQICVLFVPLEGVSTQYLITLQKSDKVRKLKERLRHSIGRPVGDIILAEALDNHISRILEDNISMQYVNDTTRVVYAYEMPPCPAVPDESPETPLVLDFSSLQDEASQYSATQTNSEGDIFSSMGTFSRRDVSDINKYMRSSGNAPEKQKESSVTSQTELSSGEQLWAASAESIPQGEQTDTHWADSQNSESWSCNHAASHWSQAESDQLRKNLNEIMDVSGTGMWNQNYSAGRSPSGSTSDWMNGCSGINETGDTASGWDLTQNIQYEETLMKSDPLPDSVTWSANTTQAGTGWDSTGAVATPAAATVVTDKWKSCAICLEELEDSELLCHKLCGGTFCQTCLEMSIKHCVEDCYVCPVCSSAAVLNEDFCPVGSSSTHNLRLLVVPVTLRDESGSYSKLVGHPRLVYLHNTMNGTQLYDSVLNLFPSLAHSTIVFTDGQGLRCSRCQYSEQCQGCPISRDSSVHLRPGDCLSVCMSSLSETCRAELEAHVQDETMEQLRPEKTLTIYDCLQAFTDSEDLDEHNPWYCPRCQRNQCAKKTITVWQYPDTLILHLKRFVYHDLSSNKVDAEVEYPLQDLNLSQYTSGPDSGSLTYDLYSIVCHFGGANAGHYTTFAKHPLNGQWYYYNDESVSQQSPKKEDFKNAYILFYSRQGTDVKFDLPKIPMDQPNILRDTLNNRSPLAALPIPSNSGKGLLPDHLMAHSDYDEVDKDRESSPQREQMTQ